MENWNLTGWNTWYFIHECYNWVCKSVSHRDVGEQFWSYFKCVVRLSEDYVFCLMTARFFCRHVLIGAENMLPLCTYCLCHFLWNNNYFPKFKRISKATSSSKDRVEIFILNSPRVSKAFIINYTCFCRDVCVCGVDTLIHMHEHI